MRAWFTAMAVRSAGAGTSEHAGREERSERQRKRSRPPSFSTGRLFLFIARARACPLRFANATGLRGRANVQTDMGRECRRVECDSYLVVDSR